MAKSSITNDNDKAKRWIESGGIPGRPIIDRRRKVTAILIGAGDRGQTYASYSLHFPSFLQIVAVAEPLKRRREKMRRLFNIPNELAVADWRDLFHCKLEGKEEGELLADCAFITTQDQLHKDPAIAFAELGYHLLLEKPMSTSEDECDEIAKVCIRKNIIVSVCHVLRYFPPCVKIRDIIDSGTIGDVVSIRHVENVGYWHFAHSFVRGNWRREKLSTFSLLAKCCHDIDLVMYWMGDRHCSKIQSFGRLHHFRREQKPSGASSRCLDNCLVERDCPYSVQKVYLSYKEDEGGGGETKKITDSLPPNRWPMSVVCDIEDHPKGYREALTEALRTGPYGRCVYDCDNDVCDYQVVNMEFEHGAAMATVTMNAFTEKMCRETVVSGSNGEVRWDGSEGGIKVYDFSARKESSISVDLVAPKVGKLGHDGADFFLLDAFLKAVASGDRSYIKTGIKDSLRSHKLVFAAEKSRKKKNAVEIISL